MRYLITLSFFFGLFTSLQAQVDAVEFGKNRVQYHDDFAEWSQYESQNFTTYWYGEARNIGQAVVQLAEYDFLFVESILEHRINDKIEIIVYTDVTDLKQSNIGSEEVFGTVGGQTKIVGNKMFVYFNGDHNDLRRQVREGIASVYLNAMLFGSNLQEIVQNAVLLNLPQWFKDGLVSYIGEEWNSDLDNRMRDAFLQKDFKDFEDFANEHPILAGHSLWYFIGLNYGRSTVSNLLYLTRINRSVESGFLYVLGSTFERTTESWMSYFEQRYTEEHQMGSEITGTPLTVKNRKKLVMSDVSLSPKGDQIVYVLNEIGRYKIFLQDVKTGERKKIFKKGYRNPLQETDYNYPLLAFNPNGLELSYIWEYRDIIYLTKYDLKTGKEETETMSSQYQRIYSMDYLTSNNLVLSGAVRGQSDLFIYFTKTRQTQRLTNDFWNDLDASVVNIGGERGIIWASNRQDSILLPSAKLDTILPIDNFDLFYYNLETRDPELVRLTHTPYTNERQPVGLDTTYYSYLSDKNGIYNQFSGYMEEYLHHYDKVVTLTDGTEIIFHPDSLISSKLDSVTIADRIDTMAIVPVYKLRGVNQAVTNLNSNYLSLDQARGSKQQLVSQWVDQRSELYIQPNSSLDPANLSNTTQFKNREEELKGEDTPNQAPSPAPEQENSNNILEPSIEEPIDLSNVPETKRDTGKVDIDNYLFQSEFDNTETPAEVIVEEDKGEVTLSQPQPFTPTIPPATTYSLVTKKQKQRVEPFKASRIIPYRLKFRTDFVTTTLDNSLLFDPYLSYRGTPEDFIVPPPGILLKANFKDLFEDYELEGGIRIPTTFNGSEYFVIFDNKKKRLDKRIAAYRRVMRYPNPGNDSIASPLQARNEVNTFLAQYQVRYPLDVFTSIRLSGNLRFDNTVALATSQSSLREPTIQEQRIFLRAEYVFDNTLDKALNIKHGTRYKFYAELMKGFNIDLVDQFQFNFNNGFTTVLGVDARHYQRFLKHSVLAFRFSAATSFGSEKVLYFLGGSDNWLFPRQNTDIPRPDPITDGFAYQTTMPNLRGFRFNIRNGNSYALINNELRVPVFQYFGNRIKSNFLRNFQLVGFFDMGTAWQGLTPYADDNPLNTKTIPDPAVPANPVTVKVRFFRDPIVLGYGTGVRMLLFGYFVRLDYAWGIETRTVQEPRLHISLGMDF